MRWGMGMLVPIALVLWLASVLFWPDDPTLLTIRVESQVTSERLAGATVDVGDVRYVADDQGEIMIDPVPAGTTVVASAAGHESSTRNVEAPGHGELVISLSGVLVYGKVVDAISGQPVEGADLSVAGPDGAAASTTRTDERGNFMFKFIPQDAALTIQDRTYGSSTHQTGNEPSMLIELEPPAIVGRVVDKGGGPIAGIEVRGERTSSISGADGRFRLDGVGQGEDLTLTGDAGTVTIVVDGVDLGEVVVSGGNGELASPEAGA